jgi:tRNA-2-methylthio-N6-dimethylallyladenosine synthase
VPKVFIKTYGCQMNERDSEAVARMLLDRGYQITPSERDADVILLNTCSVRDAAEQKAIGKMGLLAHLKREKPQLILGFLGCMAQSRGEELAKKLPAVDLVVGTQRYHHVPDYLDKLLNREPDEDLEAPFRIVDIAEEQGSESEIRNHVLGSNGDRAVTAFVSIMQGCEMFCTFCIVPYTRGAERSRPIAEIVAEVRELAAAGVKEITLLGQIVTSYGRKTIRKRDGKSAFVQLLEAVHDVDGIQRIRFTSPHPKGFGDDLVEAYKNLPKLCAHAHLPVQSGSNRVLKLMNRGYSREWFLKIVDKLRDARADIAISTDIIVGFPGETAEDFEQTLDLVRRVEFDQAFVFKYSTRRDTPAAAMPEQVSFGEKKRRNRELLELVDKVALRKNQRLVGSVQKILVEGPSKTNRNRLMGRTEGNKIVVFEGNERHRGQLLPVKIQRATAYTLYGDAAIHND